jgi:endo-alpha-1,4-polygalactosaminidase (GH114 family)
MIDWVGAISQYVKAGCPQCVVIAQNAAELVEFQGYTDLIDGIAQEQIWFDGGAENDPPGDCPLPRTEDEVDSDSYYDSLPRQCQVEFNQNPEGTLHVSSQWYLENLTHAYELGLVIFTVDYALDENNADWVYQTSRTYGFIPFVTSRGLDQFIVPNPTE